MVSRLGNQRYPRRTWKWVCVSKGLFIQECERPPGDEKQAGIGSVTVAPGTWAGLQWLLQYEVLDEQIRLVLKTRQNVDNKGQAILLMARKMIEWQKKKSKN